MSIIPYVWNFNEDIDQLLNLSQINPFSHQILWGWIYGVILNIVSASELHSRCEKSVLALAGGHDLK